jgi:small-conductance mechanosensitive channel
LMVFDSVKNLGAGLLTTAGVLSAIGAFASQQSLSRILSGLQIAFTQPIRIGDTVVVDNEFGQVEEINLSFVTVKLWDLRRLIKPTDYFTQNGVLNLTRESTQLLGTVFIYADYTLPLEAVREKFKELINQSNFWDKNVYGLDVTDATDRSLEIRLLVSAENADLLWKLRCEMREKMIAFLVDTYPECLAKTRQVPSPAFQRMTETSNKPALDID